MQIVNKAKLPTVRFGDIKFGQVFLFDNVLHCMKGEDEDGNIFAVDLEGGGIFEIATSEPVTPLKAQLIVE